MKRFNDNDIKKLKSGQQVYRTKIYPNNELNETDDYVVTEYGDRLDNIAFDYYGNSNLWWVIAVANNIHDAPIGLEEGIILRLPKDFTTITKKLM